ncbi:hypothetical protein ACI3PH_20235, partial [Lactococcus lactis]
SFFSFRLTGSKNLYDYSLGLNIHFKDTVYIRKHPKASRSRVHHCTVPPKFAPRKSEPQIDYNVITDKHCHKPYELSPTLTLFSIIVTQKVSQSKQLL